MNEKQNDGPSIFGLPIKVVDRDHIYNAMSEGKMVIGVDHGREGSTCCEAYQTADGNITIVDIYPLAT